MPAIRPACRLANGTIGFNQDRNRTKYLSFRYLTGSKFYRTNECKQFIVAAGPFARTHSEGDFERGVVLGTFIW